MVKFFEDSDYNCWRRNDCQDVPNKHQEFYNAILELSGEHFDPINWNPETYIESDKTSYQCICSKGIRNLCFIQHKKTGQRIMVGNICIEKQVPDWKGRLEYLKDVYHKKMCKQCGSRLNLRKKFCRTNLFCDTLCKDLFEKNKCVDCNKFIPKCSYKIRCLECYKKTYLVSPVERTCLGCDKNLSKEPYWKKVCLECYKDPETCNKCGSLCYWFGEDVDEFKCINCKR